MVDEKQNNPGPIVEAVSISNPKITNQKYVRFQEGSHYIQWDGVKCNKCLKMITIRAYFERELSTFDSEFQRTAKCDCGVKIFKRNGIVVLIPRQIYNRNKQKQSSKDLTVAETIKLNNNDNNNKK